MFMKLFSPVETTVIVIASFSLAWFVVGVFAGRLMPRSRTAPARSGSSRRGRKSERIELYVGNLSYDMTDGDLSRAFSRFGKVFKVRVIKNKFNGKSKGFGFVEMGDRNEISTAVRALNGKELKGRRIVVNEAKSKAQ